MPFVHKITLVTVPVLASVATLTVPSGLISMVPLPFLVFPNNASIYMLLVGLIPVGIVPIAVYELAFAETFGSQAEVSATKRPSLVNVSGPTVALCGPLIILVAIILWR